MLIFFFALLIIGIVLINRSSNEYSKIRNDSLMHRQKPINMWAFMATKHPLTLLIWIVIAIVMIMLIFYH